MEVYESNLHLFEETHTDSFIEKTEWIPYAPQGVIGRNAPLEFDIPGNSASYIDLHRSRLRVGLRIVTGEDKPVTEVDKVCLANLGLQSLFRQVDIELNQRLITASVGSYYPYKAYLDALLNSNIGDTKGILNNELFHKDSYDAMDSDSTSNIGFDRRYKRTSKGNTVFLEGPIRMDICQQKKFIINGIRIRMKLYQHEDPFRLMAETIDDYKVEIQYASLRVCQVKLSPAMVVAHEKRIPKQCAVYPFWKSDLKAFNIEKGSYGWSADDVYHGSIPSEIKIVLCSGSAFNGNYSENPFNFKNYQLNFAEVMVDGVSVPSQAITPNYTNGDFAEAYWTLMCEEPRYGRCIEMKEYPNGYCIYIFRILGRVGGDVVNQKKCGHTRINLKFAKALEENATVLLYASFPAEIRVDAARNIL